MTKYKIIKEFTFDSDYIISNDYCDRITVELIISSYDGYNAEYEIVSIWNHTRSIEVKLDDIDHYALQDIYARCKIYARDHANEAYFSETDD